MNTVTDDILLTELVLKKLDGKITGQEYDTLTNRLASSDQTIGHYNELIILHSIFSDNACTFDAVQNKPTLRQLDGLLLALAENEFQMPAHDIKKSPKKTKKVTIVKKQRNNVTQNTSKKSLRSFVAAAAAIFVLAFLVQFIPPNGGVQVATLSGSMDAKWDDETGQMEAGTRLKTGSSSLFLREGMAELLFDNDARILVDAPAEFRIIHNDQVELDYGRLYATVPPQAIGFTVSTPSSKIIDLGTEFGIDTDSWGATEVHVLKGKTMLFSGWEDDSKAQCEVIEGQAKKVTDSGRVQDVSVKERKFVRRADFDTNFIWRGQEFLCLADIVGGGNGLGTGQRNVGIDPLNGAFKRSVRGYERDGKGRFAQVSENGLIDGVFIPGKSEKGIVISSAQNRYADFRETNNKAWLEICTGISGSTANQGVDEIFQQGILLDGKNYSAGKKPFLMMHSNSGMTIDLAAVREMLPRLDIVKFETLCGIPDQIEESVAEYWSVLDIHVLLDGKRTFYKESFDTDMRKMPISIPVLKSARFLTIMVTDGGNGNHGDYVVFVEPKLLLNAE